MRIKTKNVSRLIEKCVPRGLSFNAKCRKPVQKGEVYQPRQKVEESGVISGDDFASERTHRYICTSLLNDDRWAGHFSFHIETPG